MLPETINVAVDRDIIDLAESFLCNRRGQIEEWRKALADEDIDVLRRLGHDLTGTAGSFGLHELSRLARELEAGVADGDLAKARTTMERVIEFLDRVAVIPSPALDR